MEILLNGLYHDYMPFKCMTSKKRRDMMKYRYPVMIAIFVILIAMAVVGCTTTSPSGPAATATPGGQTATTTPAATTGTGGPSLDFSQIKALEYKITTVANGQSASMNLRWEFEPTQVRMKMTPEGSSTPVFDTTVARDQASGQQGSTPLGDVMSPDFNTRLTSAGIESVTVPKGTFASTKYTITTGNIIETYWIAANVPLPIKITQVQDGKLVMSMELVDYQV